MFSVGIHLFFEAPSRSLAIFSRNLIAHSSFDSPGLILGGVLKKQSFLPLLDVFLGSLFVEMFSPLYGCLIFLIIIIVRTFLLELFHASLRLCICISDLVAHRSGQLVASS